MSELENLKIPQGHSYADSSPEPENAGPAGLRGWLIIPIIGLVLSPFLAMTQVNIFADVPGAWPVLSLVQKLVILVEVLVDAVTFVLVPIVLLVFLFKKLRPFPILYIVWIALIPVFLVLDTVVGYLAFKDAFKTAEDAFDKETAKSIWQAIVAAVIWIPYMVRSRRVKNTFVN